LFVDAAMEMCAKLVNHCIYIYHDKYIYNIYYCIIIVGCCVLLVVAIIAENAKMPEECQNAQNN